MKNIIKLQEIFHKDKIVDDKKLELFYRKVKFDNWKSQHPDLPSPQKLDSLMGLRFDTYFGMFSLTKWKRYTNLSNLLCYIDIDGPFEVNFYSLNNNDVDKLILSVSGEELNGTKVIEVPPVDSFYVYLEIRYTGDTRINSIYWASDIEKVYKTHLCVGICTFKKEDYVKRNLNVFSSFFKIYPELKDSIKIIVADNGNTLTPPQYDENIFVIPNDNLGGSAGYARVMIESHKLFPDFTYLMLMDDDVEFESASLFLAYNFLRTIKDEYRDFCLECMNFNIDYPYKCEMSMEYMDRNGIHGIYAKNAQIRSSLIYLGIDTFHSNQFGGWWGCILAAKFIRKDNLPLPLFFQFDDQEYSFRNKLQYIMLNGLAVWHEGFYKKIVPSKMYFWFRNAFITIALQKFRSYSKFKDSFVHDFKVALTQFDYDKAECMLDGFDDYLKGPDFVFNRDNAFRTFKNAFTHNKKFKPLYTFKGYQDIDYNNLCRHNHLHGFKKKVFNFTLNGHAIPLPRKNKPAFAFYDAEDKRPYYRNSNVVAINPHFITYEERKFDFKRGFNLFVRLERLLLKEALIHKKLISEYEKSYKKVTSYEFWKEYLNI